MKTTGFCNFLLYPGARRAQKIKDMGKVKSQRASFRLDRYARSPSGQQFNLKFNARPNKWFYF